MNTLTARQQQLVMHSGGVEDYQLRVGMILPGDNEFTTQADIDFIVAYRAAEQETKSGKAPPHPAPVYRAPLAADPTDPPDQNGPYGEDPAEGNTGDRPLAGAVYAPQLGAAVLNKQLFQHLLTNCRQQDAPFVPGVAPLGMAYALDQAECDWLNEHFGVTP